MERVVIALPSDENYVHGLLVTAASIACHADRNVELAFHVLDGGIKDATFAKFEERVRRWHPHCTFTRHAVDEAAFAGFPSWSGNRMTYARLLIPQFMGDEEFCIYSDTDFLWLTDIAKLWAQRDRNVVLMSTRDGATETEEMEGKWFKDHGIPFSPHAYFCGGLLFYNVRLFRELNIISQVSDFITKHPDIKFADQTAMNFLLDGQVTLLPKKWQCFSRDLTNEMLSVGCAIHYAGDGLWRHLGWRLNTITDAIMLWYAHYAKFMQLGIGKSICQLYPASPLEIVARRLLFHFATIPVLKQMFYLFLIVLRKRYHIASLKIWCRRLKWKAIVPGKVG